MSRLTRPMLLTFVLSAILGSCLHFAYALLPCPFTALFSPINESLWEHLKLLYWPGLAASLLLSRGQAPGSLAARCLCLLLSAFFMESVSWFIHVVLDRGTLWFDVALYVLTMALTILAPAFLDPERWVVWAPVLLLCTAALGLALILFTFLPPRGILFRDLSAVRSWSALFF